MSSIPSTLVKALREKTQAPMMACKEALIKTQGDIEAAEKILRVWGIAAAKEKAKRETKEGSIFSYIHPGGRIGVLLELNCETDFVAKTPEFQELGKDICMQIAAMNPMYISVEHIDKSEIEQEKEIYREQAKSTGKPDHVIEKIIEGRLKNYYKEKCLLLQPFVKDPNITIADYIALTVAKLKENIVVRRFSRFKVGE